MVVWSWASRVEGQRDAVEGHLAGQRAVVGAGPELLKVVEGEVISCGDGCYNFVVVVFVVIAGQGRGAARGRKRRLARQWLKNCRGWG